MPPQDKSYEVRKSPPAFEKWLEEVLFLAPKLAPSFSACECVCTHTQSGLGNGGEGRGEGDDDIYTAKRKEEEGAATS